MNYLSSISGLLHAVTVCSVCLIASCASERTITKSKAKPTTGLDKYNANYSYSKDENGHQKVVSDEKSQYARKDELTGGKRVTKGKDYSKQSFKKENYANKADYSKQSFQGNKSAAGYSGSPYYVKQASDRSETSTFNNSNFNTSGYRTGASTAVTSANRNSNFSNTRNAYTASKSGYKEPLIISRDDYNNSQKAKLTVKQSNSLLGR